MSQADTPVIELRNVHKRFEQRPDLAQRILALGGRPIDMYGLFTIPPVAEMMDLARSLRSVHGYAAWTLATLIGLHIAGALKHSVIDRDGTLRRMLTGKPAEA